MKLLVDTHCWLWLVVEPERLRGEVVDLLVARDNTVHVSAATAWEIVIKHALGKLSLPSRPSEYLPARMVALGHAALPIEHRHALERLTQEIVRLGGLERAPAASPNAPAAAA